MSENPGREQLLHAVSERIADAKTKKESALIAYRWQILLSVMGFGIMVLLGYLIMNQESHDLVSKKDAEDFCVKIARQSGDYTADTKPEDLSLIDHEKFHQCVDYHVGKDSELLQP